MTDPDAPGTTPPTSPPAPPAPEPAVVARFTWTADQLFRARRFHFRHRVRPSFRFALHFVFAVALLVGVRALVLAFIWSRSVPVEAYALLLASTYWFALRRIDQRWWAHRRFRSRPDRDIEVVWEASRDRIVIRSAFGRGDVEWRAFAKIVCTPEGVLLYPIDEMFHWAPRSAFASDAEFERFVELAKGGVPKHFDVT